MASTIREHMQKHHFNDWKATVLREQLKDWDKIGQLGFSKSSNANCTHEPFTMEGFLQRLARWIIVDDQVITLFSKRLRS